VWISIITALAVILTGTGAAALIIRHNINAKINYVPIEFPSPTRTFPQPSEKPVDEGPKDPINFLVLGSDSRSSGGDPTDWQAGGQRSDVMMLVQVSGDRKSVNVMSIPRDSWVPIEGHGDAKINAAFSWGGPELAISTVQNLTGVTIDHFAIVDFVSFDKLTDELGGVTIQTAAGAQQMNGEEALTFVRQRYGLLRGDFDRVRRQQAWIEAIMSAVFNKGVLKSPTKVASLIDIVLDYSAVDQGIDFDYMAGLALEVKNLRPAGVQFLTAPYTGTGRSPDGKQSIVVLDRAKLDSLMEAWRNDGVAAYIAANPDAVPTLGERPVE
jgi:LCP family protein required for cell wall assembly